MLERPIDLPVIVRARFLRLFVAVISLHGNVLARTLFVHVGACLKFNVLRLANENAGKSVIEPNNNRRYFPAPKNQRNPRSVCLVPGMVTEPGGRPNALSKILPTFRYPTLNNMAFVGVFERI